MASELHERNQLWYKLPKLMYLHMFTEVFREDSCSFFNQTKVPHKPNDKAGDDTLAQREEMTRDVCKTLTSRSF